MNKFTITMVSLVAMTGLAGAQQKGAGTGSAATGVAAGVKVDAKAGAAGTTVGAGAKVDAKTGTATAVDAKAGAGAAAPKMEMPKPPAEIAATAKAMARMTCKGQGMGMDMQMADMTGTTTAKTDLDGWWIREDLNFTVGKGKAAWKMKMVQFMNYDAKLAKWHVIGMDNGGGLNVGMADMKDGKYELTADMSSPMGSGMFRDHGDMTDKKNVKFWGEMSMDKGKSWTKVYEVTCK